MTFAGLLALGCLAARVARHTAQSALATVPLGTIAANTLGSLLVGFATPTLSYSRALSSRSQVTRRNGISRWVDDIFDVLGGNGDIPRARTVWMDRCHRRPPSCSILMTLAGMGVMRVPTP